MNNNSNTKKLMNAPVLVTRDSYIFPGFEQDLEVGRDQSIKAINIAKADFKNHIVLLWQKKPKEDNPRVEDINNVGVLARFKIKKTWEDRMLTIEVKALERVKIINLKEQNGYYQGDMEVMRSHENPDNKLTAKITETIEQILELNRSLPSDLLEQIGDDMTQNEIVDTLAQFLPKLASEVKQAILEELDVEKRLNILINALNLQYSTGKIEKSISDRIKKKIEDQQNEFYLREKMKAIQAELGELDDNNDEMKKYLDRLEKNPFPEYVKKRVRDEIARYEMMPQASSESNILRSYIEWMMSIPWYEKAEELSDLNYARSKLDENHWGLDKVKETINEFLAVKQMLKKTALKQAAKKEKEKVEDNNATDNLNVINQSKGQIICLVGPPGVGKTSLAKSIAEATGRKFVKLALGGVRDESEIRGHRKTYIGAMPGRIIQAMKRAETINPLFLLDEIDKMSTDSYRGDPASAMLEVLDPDQNTQFSDHYLEEPYNLGSVMFLATANYIENIPEPLRDRMEIIELSSYTEHEKLEIAEKHLVPKILTNNGLNSNLLQFSRGAITEIIKFYTREAGVRELERSLDKIARKFIVKYLANETKKDLIDEKKVIQYLGKHKYEYTQKEKVAQIGVVTGLAYTQFGGDILSIEANYFKGKGNLILTGKLGEVMKESASIALDYIKANTNKFLIKPEIFDEIDIHIHVPEGAVPKDGPSAGITLTTAIISLLTKRPVSKDIGMTGEITLHGNILPIGGLKEKSISAHRSGLKKILIPKENLKDLDEIPKEVKNEIVIEAVEKYDEVFEKVFKIKK